MSRRIEVCCTRRTISGGTEREPQRLTDAAARGVLDEIAGAPVDCGAHRLRALVEDGYDHLRVVVRGDEGDSAAPWVDLLGLVALAEYVEAEEAAALADASATEQDEDEAQRRHEAAHSAGVLG